MPEAVRIYGKSTWPHTHAAREDFGARGLPVEFHDVKQDPEAMRRFLELSGGSRRVPLIVEQGRVTVGYEGGTW